MVQHGAVSAEQTAVSRPLIKHPTSSVFVFARPGGQWRIGLIHHPRLGRVMMPGGHVEPAESPCEAAVREVAEESGRAIRLIGPPAPPLPEGYRPPRVAQPWWIVEYEVPPDPHLAAGHVHLDYLYVAVADDPGQVSEPEHPFAWYGPGDLPGLDMFPGARRLATVMLAALEGGPARGDDALLAATLVAGLGQG